jgi:hypothetical protein
VACRSGVAAEMKRFSRVGMAYQWKLQAASLNVPLQIKNKRPSKAAYQAQIPTRNRKQRFHSRSNIAAHGWKRR